MSRELKRVLQEGRIDDMDDNKEQVLTIASLKTLLDMQKAETKRLQEELYQTRDLLVQADLDTAAEALRNNGLRKEIDRLRAEIEKLKGHTI